MSGLPLDAANPVELVIEIGVALVVGLPITAAALRLAAEMVSKAKLSFLQALGTVAATVPFAIVVGLIERSMVGRPEDAPTARLFSIAAVTVLNGALFGKAIHGPDEARIGFIRGMAISLLTAVFVLLLFLALLLALWLIGSAR